MYLTCDIFPTIVRPDFTRDGPISIQGGRHPMVEDSKGSFQPVDRIHGHVMRMFQIDLCFVAIMI
jgi:hypothetical protein